MKNNRIRLLVSFGVISIVVTFILQFYWLNKAFDSRNKQFNQTVQIALLEVADQMAEFNNTVTTSIIPVIQVSDDYFVVNANDENIDPTVLKTLLINTFKKHNVNSNFEFGIYDCETDKMAYGSYVSMSDANSNNNKTFELEKVKGYTYYFGVRFPDKNFFIIESLNIWIFSTSLLIIVILFFGYAMYVVLDQQRTSEIRKAFVNNLTHEFKTPVATIEIATEYLINNPTAETARKTNYLTIVKQETLRLKNNLDRILQVTKLNENTQQLNLEQTKLHQIIEEVVNSMHIAANVDFDLKLTASSDLILADKLHLKNLLYNLFDNAIKYNHNPPKIEIKTIKRANLIVLSIQDNGIGIDKKYHKNIFLPFFRVPTGNLHNVKGFGIGLSYVSNIVKLHKWKVNLDSNIACGSTFTIEIPAL